MSPTVSELAEEIARAIDRHLKNRDVTLATVVGLRTNRLVEICRRHLEGRTLKSTYNADRIKALDASVAKLRAELAPLLSKIAGTVVALTVAERELKDYRQADVRLQEERRVREALNMYAEPARFVDLLYTGHRIDRGDFAALTDDDVRDIADIMKKRSSPLRTPRVRQGIVTAAKEGQR